MSWTYILSPNMAAIPTNNLNLSCLVLAEHKANKFSFASICPCKTKNDLNISSSVPKFFTVEEILLSLWSRS